MQKLKLIIGSHNHIPFGSSDEEYENAYVSIYKPFIASLYRFPKIPVVLHYSGVLLHWIEKQHPEFLMLVEELVNRKQVELISGGFYEPMLPLIPLADKLGQVEMLTTYIRKKFGKKPRGCWLPGMIWEQNLAGALQSAGMDYVFLDELQFRSAGLRDAATLRPCYTEDQGKLVAVFPVLQNLSAQVSTKNPLELFKPYLSHSKPSETRIITIIPERYSIQENSSQDEEESINAFFETLSVMEELVELTLPTKFLKNFTIEDKVYFPSSAERRVMFWAMDVQGRKEYKELERMEKRGELPSIISGITGALPRQFLVLFPEANGIYSKMMYTHALINQLRGDKYRKRTAREELWKAQGCDSFWHVVGGGIYRNQLRKAVYSSLLDAERITREKGVFTPSVVAIDFDLDGEREFLMQGTDLNAYIKPYGASIFELDYLPKAWNYLDTMARRKESYVNESVVEDGYSRFSFLDRFTSPKLSLQDAAAGKFGNCRFCAQERYEMVECDRTHQELMFRLPAPSDLSYGALEIQKTFKLKKNLLTVSYILTNKGKRVERFKFMPQIDISLAREDLQNLSLVRDKTKKSIPLEESEHGSVQALMLEDLKNEVVITFSSNLSFDLWIFPIRTRCRIGTELVDEYQSTCLMPVKAIELGPQESWGTQFSMKFSR